MNFLINLRRTQNGPEITRLLGFITSYRIRILLLVLLGILFTTNNSFILKLPLENQRIEFLRIIVPLVLLLVTAWVSINLLYQRNTRRTQALLTLKIIGHQWYWRYEISGTGLEFDSYMLPENELPLGGLRFLEVDNRLVVPLNIPITLIVSSTDVIHRWALPAYGIKIDAVAGILNSYTLKFQHVGVYYGQCSELCGVGHAFIPIVIEVVPFGLWVQWVALI